MKTTGAEPALPRPLSALPRDLVPTAAQVLATDQDGTWEHPLEAEIEDEKPHEECGIFGIRAPGEDVARLTFFGLFAL
ncbi:MAG: amidophosphoribosyltransferase, partial [Armatimonadaceae bacterium]